MSKMITLVMYGLLGERRGLVTAVACDLASKSELLAQIFASFSKSLYCFLTMCKALENLGVADAYFHVLTSTIV